MSTRQRATLDMTAEPVPGARLLLARTGDDAAGLVEDIGAQRLRELAARLSGIDIAKSDASKDFLDDSGTEFQPVSLAAILALGRQQKADAPGDSLVTVSEAAAPAPTSSVALLSAPPVSAPTADEAPATFDVSAVETAAPPEPLHFSDEAPPPVLILADDDPADALDADESVEHAESSEQPTPVPPTTDQPLMLADQSTPDIRLVDLIRRQQSLLEQLNRFPPAYDTPEGAAPLAPVPSEAPPLSVIEQLAPPAATIAPPTLEIGRDAPPPLPPPEIRVRPTPSQPAARERKEEVPEPVLSEQSPIIIQRARAERTGRRMSPAVAAPPSALPAFFVGIGVAVVIAGVLFAVL
jgi:hypothetical protein